MAPGAWTDLSVWRVNAHAQMQTVVFCGARPWNVDPEPLKSKKPKFSAQVVQGFGAVGFIIIGVISPLSGVILNIPYL